MNWELQVDLMDDAELRRFIKNLFRNTKGEEVELPTREEKLCWLGIAPALECNKIRYEQTVERNRKNGKLGGAPKGNQNAKKEESTQYNPSGCSENKITTITTQNNPNNPIIDKREKINENRKILNENWQDINLKKDAMPLDCFLNSNISIESPNNVIAPLTGDYQDSTISKQDTNGRKISTKEFREIMNDFFGDYTNWEADLFKLGFDKFIKKTTEYHSNIPEYIGLIKEFNEL